MTSESVPHSTTESIARSAPRVVLFAGGGSGGHISPGLAIAERLAEQAGDVRTLFFCSQRAIDETMLRHAGVSFTPVPATPPSLKPPALIRFVRNFRRSRRIAREAMRRESVTDVVALGGFVAAPVVAAARSLGIPVLMTNLDDPPGRANRWMAPRCTMVITAIDLPDRPGFAERVVGMPVRRCAISDRPRPICRTRLGLDADRPTLLITGASQGSTSINRFVMSVASSDPECFHERAWQVYHLCGDAQGDASTADELRRIYEDAGIPAVVEPFQHEMGLAWGAADLAISRAGASSVAEAAVNAVPTLFLPYPFHADQHQTRNARPLVEVDGAMIATDHVDPDRNVREIGPVLRSLMTDAARLTTMRDALTAHAPPDAAGEIASLILDALPGRSP